MRKILIILGVIAIFAATGRGYWAYRQIKLTNQQTLLSTPATQNSQEFPEATTITPISKQEGYLGGCYFKQKEDIYCFLSENGNDSKTILPNANIGTFEVLQTPLADPTGRSYAKDKDHVYLYGGILKDAQPQTFKVLTGLYSKDATHVYMGNEIVNEADAATFESLEGYYSKDKGHVYRYGKIISYMDPATFVVLKNSPFSKDSYHVYYDSKIYPSIDPATFVMLGQGYSRDKNNAYWNNEVVNGADIDTFISLGANNEGAYAKDKKNVYRAALIIPNEDPTTFVIPTN